MNYWLRFGLSIGSAFVAAVILDNIIAIDALLKEVILASANETSKDAISSYSYQPDQYPLLYVFIRAVLSMTLWAILVKSPKTLLFIWIISAVAVDCLRHGNMKMIFDAFSSFNIYLLILMPSLRVYIILIIIQVARVIEKQKEPRLLVGSYEGADEDLESLVPIGYDSLGVWKYYVRFHVIGSRILVTVDLVWTLIALPAVKAALGGFAGFLVTLLALGLDGYAIGSIVQRQPSGIVIWRIMFLIFTLIFMVAFGSEFLDTRKNATEQGIISTLTLALMLIFKVFIYWFTSGIESSMEPPQFSSTNGQLPQLEAGEEGMSVGEGYQVTEGDWSIAPLTPLSGRVIITELEGRESRSGWSGRVSRASHLTWGSQPGLGAAGLTSSQEGQGSRSGWGSQSILSSSRDGRGSRSEMDSQSQSVRTSREAISTVSSVSGWTTASAQDDSRSDLNK